MGTEQRKRLILIWKVSTNTVSDYQVAIGKYGNTEVDFVAQKSGILTYFQVTADMTAEETFNREMRPLQEIRDNYEKIVLTLDYLSVGNYEGIKVMNLMDWLSAE